MSDFWIKIVEEEDEDIQEGEYPEYPRSGNWGLDFSGLTVSASGSGHIWRTVVSGGNAALGASADVLTSTIRGSISLAGGSAVRGITATGGITISGGGTVENSSVGTGISLSSGAVASNTVNNGSIRFGFPE